SMALRAALVSLVASLGLSFPSAADLDGWACAAHDWINRQFADWDARTSSDMQVSWVTEAPTVEPVGNPPALEMGIEELLLTFAGETAGDENLATTGSATPAEPAETAVVQEPATPRVSVADSNFGAIVEEMAAVFAADRVGSHDATPSVAESIADRCTCGDAPTIQPLEIDQTVEPGVALAFDLNREAEGLSDINLPGPAPDPEVLDAEVVWGIELAFALNQEAEGLGHVQEACDAVAPIATADAPAEPAHEPTGDLADAVRLTGEAVFAWIKLLH